jgi:hypothetical protein
MSRAPWISIHAARAAPFGATASCGAPTVAASVRGFGAPKPPSMEPNEELITKRCGPSDETGYCASASTRVLAYRPVATSPAGAGTSPRRPIADAPSPRPGLVPFCHG